MEMFNAYVHVYYFSWDLKIQSALMKCCSKFCPFSTIFSLYSLSRSHISYMCRSLKRLNDFKRDQHHSCSLPVSPWDQRGHYSFFRLEDVDVIASIKFPDYIFQVSTSLHYNPS